MEEEKKPERQIGYIELRSEEVQELMGKVPPAILRIGISLVLLFVVLLLAVSCLVKYPETLSVSAHGGNTNAISEIRTDAAGLYRAHDDTWGREVSQGDTLFAIATQEEGLQYAVTPQGGYVYPCGNVQDGDYVNRDSVVCLLADSVGKELTAMAEIGQGIRRSVRTGMRVEAVVNGISVQGTVTRISTFPNPLNGTYSLKMVFEENAKLTGMLFCNKPISVSIFIDERSIFDKFFAGRIKSATTATIDKL